LHYYLLGLNLKTHTLFKNVAGVPEPGQRGQWLYNAQAAQAQDLLA